MNRNVFMENPLRLPPPGFSSNFDNPQFLGLPVIVTASICLPLVLLFTTVRIYARVAVVKKWKLDDYIYCLSCALGVAMISFSLSIVFSGPNRYHAWDSRQATVTKSSILSLLAFWISLGPMLWLLKLSLFSFLMRSFKSVRWLKNCAWVGIILTGLCFSMSTIVTTNACGPNPDSDVQSYLNGLNRQACSSSDGANAVVADIISVVNGVSNVFLLVLPLPLVSNLTLPKVQRHGCYFIHATAALLCLCSLMGVVYRIKSWKSTDITGNQIPFYAAFILEIALSLIIPAMPSVYTVYRHFTVPEINDSTTIATSKNPSMASTPELESRTGWHRTHFNIEQIPYGKASSDYSHQSRHVSYMKALPATPLPVATPKLPTGMF